MTPEAFDELQSLVEEIIKGNNLSTTIQVVQKCRSPFALAGLLRRFAGHMDQDMAREFEISARHVEIIDEALGRGVPVDFVERREWPPTIHLIARDPRFLHPGLPPFLVALADARALDGRDRWAWMRRIADEVSGHISAFLPLPPERFDELYLVQLARGVADGRDIVDAVSEVRTAARDGVLAPREVSSLSDWFEAVGEGSDADYVSALVELWLEAVLALPMNAAPQLLWTCEQRLLGVTGALPSGSPIHMRDIALWERLATIASSLPEPYRTWNEALARRARALALYRVTTPGFRDANLREAWRELKRAYELASAECAPISAFDLAGQLLTVLVELAVFTDEHRDDLERLVTEVDQNVPSHFGASHCAEIEVQLISACASLSAMRADVRWLVDAERIRKRLAERAPTDANAASHLLAADYNLWRTRRLAGVEPAELIRQLEQLRARAEHVREFSLVMRLDSHAEDLCRHNR